MFTVKQGINFYGIDNYFLSNRQNNLHQKLKIYASFTKELFSLETLRKVVHIRNC